MPSAVTTIRARITLNGGCDDGEGARDCAIGSIDARTRRVPVLPQLLGALAGTNTS